jgi:hypothetical protein
MLLAGGIMGQGYQCGQVWGAALAAGARAYQIYGGGAQAETAAVIAAQRLMNVFNAKYHAINCSDLTVRDMKVPQQALKFLAKGGPIRCFSMTAGYASTTARELNAAFPAEPPASAPAPISCTAALARGLGLSELHVSMAAGLAGGIGLSGEGCGVLGAAIWIASLRDAQTDAGFSYNNPKANALIEKFLESSGYEFECHKITGRRFGNVYEHASYVRDGGCQQIITALAAAVE